MVIMLLSSFTLKTFSQELKDVSPMAPHSSPMVTDNSGLLWDVITSFPVTAGGEQGIAFANDKFYTSMWSADNLIREYDVTTHALITSWAPSPAFSGLRDFAYDGTFLYGGTNGATLYKIDPTTHASTSVSLSGATIRHLTYDPAAYSGAGGFWAGGWADMKLYPKTGGAGTVTAPAPESAYSSCYDNKTTGGPFLWLFCQTNYGTPTGTELVDLVQYDIATNTYTGTIHNCSDVTGIESGAMAGGCESYFNPSFAPNKLAIICNAQQSINFVYALELWAPNSVTEIQKNENLAIWPNPAKVNSTINMITTSTITNVKVYNAIGQVVYNENMNKHEVNISTENFVPGTYVVSVIKDDGAVTRKIVVN